MTKNIILFASAIITATVLSVLYRTKNIDINAPINKIIGGGIVETISTSGIKPKEVKKINIDIPFLESDISSSGKRILVDIRTNLVVNDFQSDASAGILKSNAVRAGLGQDSDFKEVIVSEGAFDSYVSQYKIGAKPILDADKATRLEAHSDITGKIKSVLTDDEILQMQELILDGIFIVNP